METQNHDELPLFPLGTVLFPGNTLPLRIFEPRYVDLIGRCMRDGTGFGVVGILEGREAGPVAVPYTTGTSARIIDFDRGGDGLLNIVIRGTTRFRIIDSRRQDDTLLVARIAPLAAIAEMPVPAEFRSLSELLEDILANAPLASDARDAPRDCAALAYSLAQYLPLSIATKVSLLEIDEPLGLLSRLTRELQQLREGASSN